MTFNKNQQKWVGKVYHNGKPHYVGCFDDDLKCAKKVNAKCKEINKPILNPGLEGGVLPV